MVYNKILVTLDGSELSEAALPHAAALAHCSGAHISLLRVAVPPMYIYPPIGMTPPINTMLSAETMRVAVAEYLESKAATLRATGLNVTTSVQVNVMTADTILSVAQALAADLIVMSTHGRSGVTRWLLGSVADKITHVARVPLLLVRPTAQALAKTEDAHEATFA